jgi:hypothetical protein|nr:hypothetical protein [Neorhizobium tomejilense]
MKHWHARGLASFRKATNALFLVLALTSAEPVGAAGSIPKNCTGQWMKIWDARSDQQKWGYADLAYYAESGAYPQVVEKKYTSVQVSAFFAALALESGQGVDFDIETNPYLMTDEVMDKFDKSSFIRRAVARYHSLGRVENGEYLRDDCISKLKSSDCLIGLIQPLLPDAKRMAKFILSAIQSDRLGNVPCVGGIQYSGGRRLR